ncbi:TetR/AcrR family transcriptional regulator [Qaidamihabitans albus]|uniref:TetR/AcrR family transcriptional regulator n=1 Tax=Qaidamihabitans albus TaxID=2795733 RepID=UPI0018F22944|nr:TetR/AcrR family transcriptional regulator [Qaidamihabitans albus]
MSERAERILGAAGRLLLRFGAGKTTIDDIAREAAVSKGSVYLEFRSKRELFEALVRWEFRAYLTAVRSRVDDDPEGGRLSRIHWHAIDELLARPLMRALYTRDADVLGGMLRRHGAPRYAPRLVLGREFVEHMQRAGLVRPGIDAKALGETMAVLSVGLVAAAPVLGGDSPSPASMDMFAAMLTEYAEAPAGPGAVAAGKQAFADLCRELDEQVAR